MAMLAGAESEDATSFSNSILELKDLCSQLHQAADYCQSAFSKANKKTSVVESTKEYVCRAVVTVIDHLGNVSANLNYELSKADNISQTQLRIYSLQQRLVTCQDYSQKLAVAKFRLKPRIARYHTRYLSPPPAVVHPKSHQLMLSLSMGESGNEIVVKSSVSKRSCKIEDEVPPVLPVKDSLSLMPKPQSFSFQFQEVRKARRNMLIWKSMQNNDIFSLIRRGK